MARPKSNGCPKDSTATIGFEAKLWLTADKLRDNMDAAETSGASRTAAGSPQGERGGANRYFLTRFANAEGKNGGQWSGATWTATGCPKGERGSVHQFYTPSCLVEMLAPYKGRIYDPACGSGGSLPASRLCGVRFAEKDRATAQGVVQSKEFVEAHGRNCNGMHLA